MDRQYIRDAQVIERYLHGRLTPAEEEAFEEAYLADPALLDELQLAEKLRDGLRDLPQSEQGAAPARRPRWLELTGSPRYGLAASLLAAVAVLASANLYLENQALKGGGSAVAAPASSMRLLPLVSVRGAGDANVVSVPRGDEWTVLLLDAGFTDYDRYRAVLTRRNGGSSTELLRVDDLQPSYEGLLALGVPARVLTAGDYEIRLEGGRRDWPAGRELDELARTPLTVQPAP
jgi:hypothetical protein